MLYEKIQTQQIIYGSRITQARELSGLTQTELAQKLGVNQSYIAQIENDIYMPSEVLVNALSSITGFLPSFFRQAPMNDFPAGSLCYRSRKSLSAREASQAYQYARTVFEQVKIMTEHVKLPPVRLPRITDQPTKVAQITRTSFGLSSETPIKNLMNIAEKNGVIILTLPMFLSSLDAFSTWVEIDVERPIIAISSRKTTDRTRFSIAHELGHLAMHQALKGNIPLIENEAFEFASELLLPGVAMQREFIKPVVLDHIAKLKLKWGVSMQALIYRARELQIITDRQARYLFSQMSARGWKMREPKNLDLPTETPKTVSKIIELLFNDTAHYASEMNMTPEKAREFILWT